MKILTVIGEFLALLSIFAMGYVALVAAHIFA